MEMLDRLPIDNTRRTADGYMATVAKVARTGIQEYRGYEVGKPDKDIVRVYRPADEVFSDDAMHSFAHRPVTLGHPDVAVTADNWKQFSVGQTGDEVDGRDGKFIRVPLVLMDASAIRSIEDGTRQLSMGYTCDLDWTAGETPDGLQYDALQRNIRANHLAVVSAARGGPELKIGDKDMPEIKTRTILVDGLSVETTDQGAQAIEKLQADVKRLNDAATTAKSTHDQAIAAKDAELAKKDAEIDGLKGKVLDGAALDAKVAARAEMVATAKAIHPDVVTDGKSDADIRKAVLTAKGITIDGKSDAYIEARFDALADGVKDADPMRDAIRTVVPVADARAAADQAWKKSTQETANAWQAKH